MIISLIILVTVALAGLAGWVLRKSIAEAPEGYEDAAGFHFGRLPRRFRRRSATVRVMPVAKPSAVSPVPQVEVPAA